MINIFKDQEFNEAREVLLALKKAVRQNAKRKKPQAARELPVDEEDHFFSRGEFGDSNPKVLRRAVWSPTKNVKCFEQVSDIPSPFFPMQIYALTSI